MKTAFLYFIYFTISFILSTTWIYAQNNYRPGYVITLQQDTIYGEIDFRTDIMNSKRCIFRSYNNTQTVTYQPFDITGYRFTDNGKYYVSKNIELQYGIPKPVFLEYLLQGMKSLYFYETETNTPIYFIENDDTLIKIDAPKLSKKTVKMQFKNQVDRYIPILHYAFQDCPDLAQQIDHSCFSRKDMIKIAKEYHNKMCTNNENCIEFEAKEEKTSIQIEITPYIGVIQYNIPSKSLSELYNTPQLSYLTGVTLAVNNPRWIGSISGCIDLSLSRISSFTTTQKYSGTMLSGKLGTRYTYLKRSIQPFVEFGADFSGMINSQIKENEKSKKWLTGLYPGYYVHAGINFKLPKRDKQMICLRAQFKSNRDIVLKVPLFNSWSGSIGYVF